MNKFTRSQMGKIMAYALSAAMAVTVVPTYMMKPLTVMAEVTTPKADATLNAGDTVNNGDTATFTKATLETPDSTTYDTEVSSVVNLYNNKNDKTPAYTLKENEAKSGKVTIPFDVKAGNYYAEVVTTYKTTSDETTKDAIGEKYLVAVEEATLVTGAELSATNKTLYFKADGSGGVSDSNQEVVSTKIKGGENARYNSITYKAKASADNVFKVTAAGTSNTANAITTTEATLTTDGSSTNIATPTDLIISVGSAPKDGATLTITVTIDVEGRENPIEKEIKITASDKLEEVKTISVSEAKDIITVDDSTSVSTSVNPTNSVKKITYLLKGKNTDADVKLDTYTDGNLIKLVDKTGGSDTSKADSKDTVYAIFDTSTGELTAKKYGEYTVTAFADKDFDDTVDSDEISDSATVTAIEFKMDDAKATVGSTGTGAGSLSVLPTTVTKAYANYSVEDSDIATVSGIEKSFDVTAKKPGITKVNADVTVYGKEVYKFDASGYVVVLPKADDENFKITDVDNTEAYINRLAKNGDLSEDLPLQVGEAAVNGDINVKVLSDTALKLAESALGSELTAYYKVTNTGNNSESSVTANGLLISAYDPDVVAVEDPEKSVKVKLVVSDLHADDEEDYKMKDSICEFVSELTVDGKVTELNTPVWLTVKNSNFKKDGIYTVYDNGEDVYVAECTKDGELTFQTPSFSVFSIVLTPDATPTDFEADIEKPDATDDIYDKVDFSAHVQRRIGTDDEADIAATVSDDGIISLGTHGQSRRVEKITLTGLDADEVEMTAHVQKRVDHPEDVADLTQVVNEDGSISIGTEHQSRRIEAFSMNLKGDLAEQYDVYYRVHAQNYGWLGWAKNGEIAGTSGHSFRLEGIEIIFVEKGTEFDESQYVKTPEEGDRGYSEKAAYMDRVVSEK